MNFYTSSSFRETLGDLLKKRKDGYSTAVSDICKTLADMPLNILRDTNDRIIQASEYRVVKLRVPNSGLRLSKSDGFRLIYIVSMLSEDAILMRVYPKRGSKGIENLTDAEFLRLIEEAFKENQEQALHQVDIANLLSELSTTASF